MQISRRLSPFFIKQLEEKKNRPLRSVSGAGVPSMNILSRKQHYKKTNERTTAIASTCRCGVAAADSTDCVAQRADFGAQVAESRVMIPLAQQVEKVLRDEQSHRQTLQMRGHHELLARLEQLLVPLHRQAAPKPLRG